MALAPLAQPDCELEHGQTFRSAAARLWHHLQSLSQRNYSRTSSLRRIASVYSRSCGGIGRAHRRNSREQPAASIRKIELRNFAHISRFSGSPEYKILAGLLDEAHAL